MTARPGRGKSRTKRHGHRMNSMSKSNRYWKTKNNHRANQQLATVREAKRIAKQWIHRMSGLARLENY